MVKALQTWKSPENSYGLKNYAKLIDNPGEVNSLDLFVEVALEKWQDKLS
ncbi:MAG: hypothetical protein F6K47_16780 [Symploca sp. SIO2E6]|nr:hypothetical protein [Symploca sp. SIO2E6]